MLFRSAALALCCLTASQSLVAADRKTTTPNVIYTATGTFGTPISGPDNVGLAGEPFTIQIEASEALVPTSGEPGWAEYTGFAMQFTFKTPYQVTPITLKNNHAEILLVVGNPAYDVLALSSTINPFNIGWLKFRAEALLPKGTLANDMVLPLTVPYTLTAGYPATFTLACAFIQSTFSYCDTSPLLSTTLSIASGTLTTPVK